MQLLAVLDKYGRRIIVCTCLGLVLVWAVLIFSFAVYMKNEPSFSEAKTTLLLICQGKLKPSLSGAITTADREVYVTRAANGALTVLWPYNLAHDDNYFEGLLFSDQALTTNKITALAPTRYTTAHKPWMTHLTIDHTISSHWYHVQGEMYK